VQAKPTPNGDLAEDGKTVKRYYFGFGNSTQGGEKTALFWEEVVEGLGDIFRNKKIISLIPFTK